MADHCAIQLRDSIVSAILGASTDAGTRVEGSRLFNWTALPAVSVMVGEAEYPADQQTLDNEIFHEQIYECRVYVEEAGDVDKSAFNIAAQLTAAALTDSTVLSQAKGIWAIGVGEPEHTTESEKRAAKLVVLFLAKFVTSETDLTVFL